MKALTVLVMVSLAVLPACTIGATNVWDGKVAGVAPTSRPTLSKVAMNYSTWTSSEVADKLRPHEAEYLAAISKGFEERMTKEKLGDNKSALPITIKITDINPGSQAARWFVGFGAGKGFINAEVRVGSRGTFMIRQAIVGGFFGGSFKTNCEELGEATAHHVSRLVRGEETPAAKP